MKMKKSADEKRLSPRVKEPEAVRVEIGGSIYNIFNMGPTGIGFLLKDTGDFYEGKITPLRLITNKNTYDLQGEVVHFSEALHLPSGGIYLCGVKLIFDSDENRAEIEKYIEREGLA
jgi:hypothetical protein